MLKSCLLTIALLSAAASSAVEVEDNCARCHSNAPVPEAHPPVAQVTPQSCGMCHHNHAGDGYFTAVHDKHQNLGLSCASCHGDGAGEGLTSQLAEILEQ